MVLGALVPDRLNENFVSLSSAGIPDSNARELQSGDISPVLETDSYRSPKELQSEDILPPSEIVLVPTAPKSAKHDSRKGSDPKEIATESKDVDLKVSTDTLVAIEGPEQSVASLPKDFPFSSSPSDVMSWVPFEQNLLGEDGPLVANVAYLDNRFRYNGRKYSPDSSIGRPWCNSGHYSVRFYPIALFPFRWMKELNIPFDDPIRRTEKAEFHCRIFFNGTSITVPLSSNVYVERRKFKPIYLDGSHYCDVPITALPKSKETTYRLAITRDAASVPKISVVVKAIQEIEKPPHFFGVCLYVVYGDRVNRLIEWFEYHKLMGVSHVEVYADLYSMSRDMEKVMDHYVKEGFVTMKMHRRPAMNKWTYVNNGAVSRMQDCWVSNMFKYEHLTFVDFDEFVMPGVKYLMNYTDYAAKPLVRLLRDFVAQDDTTASAMIYSHVFPTNCKFEDQPLETSSYRMRFIDFSKYRKIEQKIISRPRLVDEMWYHGVIDRYYHPRNTMGTRRETHLVRDIDAVYNHYRSMCTWGCCKRTEWTCCPVDEVIRDDNLPDYIGKELLERYTATRSKLGFDFVPSPDDIIVSS
eukprot:CAMPEP_0184671996 /NCGR_PEP_ID=MMETSP0308-20130426/85832_1 /TAXON_ID=38269 /ORGANISM="Gloeochaete witrockiana, Strain SAG 46.84" /LENGTH=580 /DNA_ID=CAMNT_0027119233 /DNA_START=185 /DNA_END=1928 /DNA_ORIENTATION=-